MSDRHEEIECYECGRLKTRIIWQGRCVTCAVQRLESNLEENDTLRSENAALKARTVAPTDNGIAYLDSICSKFNDGKIDLGALVCRIWNNRQKEVGALEVRVAELETVDPNLISECGCRFENDTGSSVLLCEACSELPCHNPDARDKGPANEG